ncbi:probable disease resistance protein RF9 [Cynara cardunculus var. scolymus]|uniref:probable disease resistance protein RF9 n=1 Tax=Cynara cardunculus var. scolymus TaxID=59895 RepID=UPI000D62FF59|nr:probable disease resistance protein RF9 [Cynara cardunculus var. scolymus]
MAAEAVVSVMIQKLSDFLDEESEIFEKVKDEVEKVMEGLKSILNSAQYQEQSSTMLMSQVLSLLGIVYRVEDTIESFCFIETRLKRMSFVKKHFSVIAKEVRLFRIVLPDTMEYSQNVPRLKSKMERFSKEIHEWEIRSSVLARLQGSHGMHQHEQQTQEPDAYRPPRIEDTISKKKALELLKRQITSNIEPLQIISVFGEIGIDNAPQVKTIYKSRVVTNMFPCHAWLVVDTNWSFRHLILAILKEVTSMKGMEKLIDEVLIGRLHGFLNDKKYLIVINDIKSLDLLKKLRGALPDAHNGSRVVITTPDERTASFADVTSPFCYKHLDMKEAMKTFIEKVKGLVKGSPVPGDIMEDHLKRKVAEICRGNPLRFALLVGFLSTRKVKYKDWLRVFKQNVLPTKFPTFDLLAFCYNDLPVHLKPCFLYLGLFEKGFEIPVRRLFRLWLAEGFVKPSEEGIILEDIVERYLEELVNRNMVEITKNRSDESPKKCRMTASLHDIFRPRGLEIGLFHLHQKSEENSYVEADSHRLEVRRVVECTNIKDYTTSQAFNQNLQSYISLNNRKKDMFADEVGIFLETIVGTRGFGLLKVLDLEGVDRPRLPEILGNLFLLRYLGLRCTFLNALPSSLGALLHLETLDIKHTQIRTVPSSIWNMKHLRHLCLNGAHLDIPVKSMKHTDPLQLQTLQGLFVDEKIARKIGSTLKRMTNLRKLDLTREACSTTTTTRSHSSSYEEISSWISSPSCLQSLRLRSINRMGQPSELIIEPFSSFENLSQLYLLGKLLKPLDWYQIPSGLKVLTLSVSQLDEDPMPTLSKLKNLIDLRLLASSYKGEEMCLPQNGFPALRVLKLWKLENLKRLTVKEGTMQKLHTLEIRCCKNLNKEGPETLLKIEELCNLILTDMPKPFVTAMNRKKKKHTLIEENP